MNMDSIIDDNKKALDFLKNYLDYIKEICTPLKYLGIKYFEYGRLYLENNHYILETNNYDFTEKYLQNIFAACFIRNRYFYSADKYYISLMAKEPKQNNHIQMLYFTNDIWNCVAFYKVHKNYLEGWGFGGAANDENTTLAILKNEGVIRNFINYYEANVAQFRNNDIKHYAKFISFDSSLPSKEYLISNDEAVNELLSYIGSNGYKLRKGSDLVHLTKREYECINYLANGSTLKSTAKKLQLSPRTIEMHVNNVKVKTGINYKADLVDWFHEVKET